MGHAAPRADKSTHRHTPTTGPLPPTCSRRAQRCRAATFAAKSVVPGVLCTARASLGGEEKDGGGLLRKGQENDTDSLLATDKRT